MNHELRSGAYTRIAGRWLFITRLSFVVVSIFDLVLYVIGTPVYFAYLHTLCTGCFDERLSPDKLQALQALGISITTYAVYWVAINLLFALVYFAVAALIFWRKSDDWMALLASFSLVAFGASFPSIPAVLAAIHPGWWLPVTLLGENVLGFPSLMVFFFLFPTGRFVPRWTRWVALGFAVLQVVTAFYPVSYLNFSTWPGLLFPLAALVVFGSLVFSQVYRYRRISTPVERQQTKWIVFGAAVGLLGFLLLGVLLPALLQMFIPLQSLDPLLIVILVTGIYLVLLLIPLSFAIAILRYRLWDVDVLINKTIVYGLLTGILIAMYAGCIVGLEALLQGLFHQTSEVAIVVSTLLIAALFQPLRKRIQAGIDRRFFRHKYDAARTLAAFSVTLRNEVDLDQLREQLVAVVQETMQPAHVSLWLRKTERERNPILMEVSPPGWFLLRGNEARAKGLLAVVPEREAIVMMGTKAHIFAPIAVVSLEDLVPSNHFYRQLDHVLDLSFVRDLVKETYAHGGRPSIDPVVFFKLQLVMFFEGIVRCANRIS